MIIDSHVHLMPPRLGRAIRAFFERHIGDQLVYPSDAAVVLDRHHAAGAVAVWNLPYAHKPGMADDLNAGMAEVAAAHAEYPVHIVTGCTVHPGDDQPQDTLRRAFELHGARVLKLHCSVGSYDADDPRLAPVFEAAGELAVPVVVHAGHDVSGHTHGHELAPIAQVAERHGGTTVIVAHCGHEGNDETTALMRRLPNLWADLTPVVMEHPDVDAAQLAEFADRLLLGTDAPNTGRSLDDQLAWLRSEASAHESFTAESLAAILGENATRLIPLP